MREIKLYELDIKHYTKSMIKAMEEDGVIIKFDFRYCVVGKDIKEIRKAYYQPNYLHSVIELKSGKEIAIKGDGDKMCNLKESIESLHQGEAILVDTTKLKFSDIHALRVAIKDKVISVDEREITYIYKNVDSVLNGNTILPEMVHIKL